MSEELPMLERTSTVTIGKIGKEVELARFDILGSKYYSSRWMIADYLLLTETSKRLPSEAYFVSAKPVSNNHSWRNLELYPTGPFTYEGFLPAIRISINGSVVGDNYTQGTRLNFSLGILFGPKIRDWSCWRYIQTWWSPEVWENIGFDYRKFERNSSVLQPSMETMEFKNPTNLDAIDDAYLQILCDFTQINFKHPQFLGRALRARARSTTEEQMSQAFATGRARGFSEIRNVDSLISERAKRLLVINMLFNYWETKAAKLATRSTHIKQLGLGGPSETSMWNDSAEAGCFAQPKSICLKNLKQICKQATRFFRNHPEEFARLEEDYLYECAHRPSDGSAPTLYRHTVRLPMDARRSRKKFVGKS